MKVVLWISGALFLLLLGAAIGERRGREQWGTRSERVTALRDGTVPLAVYKMLPRGYVILEDQTAYFIDRPFPSEDALPLVGELTAIPTPSGDVLLWSEEPEMVLPGVVPAEDWNARVQPLKKGLNGAQTAFTDWKGHRITVTGL
ncbi:hypothetical protein EON81_24805 [bacterium]|nr:MAG: hypothetical protein EON81_24805 [bacterium]